MNEEKRTEAIDEASQAITSRAELELSSIYMKAYHEGRHDLRDKYKDYLMIDQSKRELLKDYSQDPCIKCVNSSSQNVLGCLLLPQKCINKQNQLLALDILKYFK